MSFFQDSRNVAVLGGTQVAVAAGGINVVNIAHERQPAKTSAFRELSGAAAHTALHNSSARYDAPRCHRNTRAKQLDKLELWALGKSDEYAETRLLWLCGGAGAGKSAIMQSIVERCLPHGVVLGAFFFFRADESRNTAEVLIPTLAYQLARTYPAAMTVLESVITRDPLIFKASLHTQAYELLVRPLLYLQEAGAITSQGIFFIDGLDECDSPRKQALIIETIAGILREYSLPIAFLIASRPEITIHDQFNRQYHGYDPVFSTMPLDDDDEARADIQQYIEDRFLDIVELHPMRLHITLPWPSTKSVDNLVWKSSGHFIYAAIAMNYIASHDEHPIRALKVIEDLEPARSASPFSELDALYLHVLTSAKFSSELLNILRHCFFTDLSNDLQTLNWIHGLSEADVQLYLSDVQAFVTISSRHNVLSVQSKHASLQDFLSHPSRAQHVYISRQAYCASLLPRLLHLLGSETSIDSYTFWNQRFGSARATIVPIDACSTVVMTLSRGISGLKDAAGTELLMRYPLTLIWAHIRMRGEPRMLLGYTVAHYMDAIFQCHNFELYLHHFRTYVQILLDSLDSTKEDALLLDYPPTDMSFWKEHIQAPGRGLGRHAISMIYRNTPKNYSIIPALVFTSTRSSLRLAHHALFRFSVDFGVNPCYACYLSHLVRPSTRSVSPVIMKALRSLPESRFSWRAELALLMQFTLQKLLHESWKAPFYFTNRHDQWLKCRKPWKHVSIGSPLLSTQFYDYKRGCPTTKHHYDLPYDAYAMDSTVQEIYQRWKKSGIIFQKGYDCVLLLRLVISFLHKADCTPEVAMLARKSLPQVACWFPKLMKRARRQMDAYVLRWEDSPACLLQKAQSLSLNNID